MSVSTFVVVQVAAAPSAGSLETIVLPAMSATTQSETEGHETVSTRLFRSSTAFDVHVADAPSAGSVDVRALPCESKATHSDCDGHESPKKSPESFPPAPVAVQVALAPSPGSVETSTSGVCVTTAQNVDVGHETYPAALTLLTDQVGDGLVGSVVDTTSPEFVVATQRDVDAHETPLSVSPPPTVFTVHVAEPPSAGSVETTKSPRWPTAAQNEAETHVMLYSGQPSPEFLETHVGFAAVGFVVVTMLYPSPSTATQRLGDPQEMSLSGRRYVWGPAPSTVGHDQIDGAVAAIAPEAESTSSTAARPTSPRAGLLRARKINRSVRRITIMFAASAPSHKAGLVAEL